jgi:hypothetical protein
MQPESSMTEKETRIYHVAVLPGDGIGTELMPPALSN